MQPLRLTRKKLPDATVADELRRICQIIAGAVSPLEIIVFGSAARGEMTDQSDIDLLLVFKEQTEVTAARPVISRLAPLSQYPVDILYVDRAEFERKRALGGVYMIADQEGKRLYKREAVSDDQGAPV